MRWASRFEHIWKVLVGEGGTINFWNSCYEWLATHNRMKWNEYSILFFQVFRPETILYPTLDTKNLDLGLLKQIFNRKKPDNNEVFHSVPGCSNSHYKHSWNWGYACHTTLNFCSLWSVNLFQSPNFHCVLWVHQSNGSLSFCEHICTISVSKAGRKASWREVSIVKRVNSPKHWWDCHTW